MSAYTGTFTIDDRGVSFFVNVPSDGTKCTMCVAFSFEQLNHTADNRVLLHGVIARRVTEAFRSLDEED